jgi:hypothetical protein
MTARKLREWRGVKQVAAPTGIAVTTRVATSERDKAVLSAVAAQTSTIRRADLAARTGAVGAQQDNASRARRKRGMTAASSARMAGTAMRGNDDQYRLARRAQTAKIKDLKAGVATITARLAAPTRDRADGPAPKRRRRAAKTVRGYATQAERYQKQRRRQVLAARLVAVEKDAAVGKVSVVAGGARLMNVRNNLEDAGLTLARWRERWDAARDVFEANGSTDEPHGNLTITVCPQGNCSIRLPRPLEHLANAERGRYVLNATVAFPYRGDQWAARTAAGAVSYTFARRPGRAGWYLRASWALTSEPVIEPGSVTRVAGVDLNDGHLAVRLLDQRGNPSGAPARIEFALTGTVKRRDAQVRHAITRLIRWCVARGVDTIAVEDLNFTDARATGRETMGRGGRGKTFRRTVAGIPTAVFRDRLADSHAHRCDCWPSTHTSAGAPLAETVWNHSALQPRHRDRRRAQDCG